MNKYSDKSDFEINKAVAEIYLHGKYLLSEENQEVYFGGMDGGDFLPNGYFDPCNDPADAMPIINEYGISLVYQDRQFQFATNDGNIECSISNPLKAAMIIFLMMKDAE